MKLELHKKINEWANMLTEAQQIKKNIPKSLIIFNTLTLVNIKKLLFHIIFNLLKGLEFAEVLFFTCYYSMTDEGCDPTNHITQQWWHANLYTPRM